MSIFDAAEALFNGLMLLGEFFAMRFSRSPLLGRIAWWITLTAALMIPGAPLAMLLGGYESYALWGLGISLLLAFIGFVVCAILSDT